VLSFGRTRIHLATRPADFRKSIDGLSGEVRRVLDDDPTSGHLFVFHNRRRTALKLLWWDRGAFNLLYRRLERGRFRLPDFHREATRVRLSRAELEALVEGLELMKVRAGERWEPTQRT
jgi:transposase